MKPNLSRGVKLYMVMVNAGHNGSGVHTSTFKVFWLERGFLRDPTDVSTESPVRLVQLTGPQAAFLGLHWSPKHGGVVMAGLQAGSQSERHRKRAAALAELLGLILHGDGNAFQHELME